MTTTLDLVTSALRRLRIVSLGQTPRADYSKHALTALNDMIFEWEQSSINLLRRDANDAVVEYSLTDEFVFWVPPKELRWDVISAAVYKGTWDATANSPSLASGSGTSGNVYKVATAGSTTLDGVSTWAVNDFLVFDGAVADAVQTTGLWRKCPPSRRFESGIHALLAVRLAGDFGRQPQPQTYRDAENGWTALCSAFVRPPTADVFDSALRRMPSNRYADYLSSG